MGAIKWTARQREIANLLKQGKTQKEIIAAGYKKATISRVRTALKAEEKEMIKQGGTQNGTVPSISDTRVRVRTLDPVEVGGIIIEPADWRINQYGGFLILNTYEHARKKYGYSGTVGDFVCDACQVMRKVMGLDLVSTEYLIKVKEDDNGRREEGQNNSGGQLLQETRDNNTRGLDPAIT
ncbi:MAG: hypothetical protein ACUVTR_02025 [Dehalococcoidia bacterium]